MIAPFSITDFFIISLCFFTQSSEAIFSIFMT
jgi:hypothetical protein